MLAAAIGELHGAVSEALGLEEEHVDDPAGAWVCANCGKRSDLPGFDADHPDGHACG